VPGSTNRREALVNFGPVTSGSRADGAGSLGNVDYPVGNLNVVGFELLVQAEKSRLGHVPVVVPGGGVREHILVGE